MYFSDSASQNCISEKSRSAVAAIVTEERLGDLKLVDLLWNNIENYLESTFYTHLVYQNQHNYLDLAVGCFCDQLRDTAMLPKIL